MMTAAAGFKGGAATPQLAVRRARVAIADAADALAAACRGHQASPADIAAAERRLADAFAVYGGLMLLLRAIR